MEAFAVAMREIKFLNFDEKKSEISRLVLKKRVLGGSCSSLVKNV